MRDYGSYELLQEYARHFVHTRLPVPAQMDVDAVVLSSRREAYAFAIALMSKADSLWTGEAV